MQEKTSTMQHRSATEAKQPQETRRSAAAKRTARIMDETERKIALAFLLEFGWGPIEGSTYMEWAIELEGGLWWFNNLFRNVGDTMQVELEPWVVNALKEYAAD